MDLTIVSAVPFEVTDAVESLQSRGHSVQASCFGIGSLEAARNCHKLERECSGRDVIYIGTCGDFYGFTDPTVFRIGRVSWLPYGERVGACYQIEGLSPEISLNKSLPSFNSLPIKHAICASTISMNATLPKDIDSSLYVENVELYSVAETLERVSKSFTVLLTTTNSICDSAHSQWLANHKQAAKLTAEVIKNILDR